MRDCSLHALSAGLPAGVATTGSSSSQWDDAGLCRHLSTFAKACQTSKVRSQLLDPKPGGTVCLPGGAVWLGLTDVTTAELFVRPCYIELLEARAQYLKTRGFEDKPGTTIFTGTPGIGKSHLGGLVVGQALVQSRAVLLEVVPSDKDVHKPRHWYLITPAGDVERTADSMVGQKHLDDAAQAGQNLLYVVDGGVPTLDGTLWNGEAYVFSSPKQHLDHAQVKGFRVLVFYVPLFSLAELLSCKSRLTLYQDMSDDNLRAWFATAGGVACVCLKRAHTEGLDRGKWLNVNEKLNELKTKDMVDALRLIGTSGFPPGSDAIFHWDVSPTEDLPANAGSPIDPAVRQFTRRSLRFASPESTAVGYWLEILAFARLRMGGKLQAALLPAVATMPRRDFILNLPAASLCKFWASPAEAATCVTKDLTVLGLPWSKSEPAIDAMSSPCLYWQVTKAGRHGIVRDAIAKMNTATGSVAGGRKQQLMALANRIDRQPGQTWKLTKPVLCFVVPLLRFDEDYKSTQRYTAPSRGGNTVSQKDLVHQVVLRLPVHEILEDASDPAARQQFERAMEDLYRQDAESGGAGELATDVQALHIRDRYAVQTRSKRQRKEQ
ncbi:g11651 [Coccomyxa elongata]